MEVVSKIVGHPSASQVELARGDAPRRTAEEAPQAPPNAQGFSAAGVPQTGLSFQANRNTGGVTVVVYNSEAGEVLRTVPPEELNLLAHTRGTSKGLPLEKELRGNTTQ